MANNGTSGQTDSYTVKGACPQDCPDTCAMIYHVEDGELVDVTGDPDNNLTKGRLCAKLKDFAKHHANPERLLYPMKRSGKKGSGEFEKISWDEALETISTRWNEIIDEYGAEAILPHAYLGNIGTLNGLTVGDRFFNALKTSVAEKTYCESGSSTAWIMTVGAIGGIDPESFAYSKCIVFWAQNPLSTQTHCWPFVMQARENGAKLIVIDPVKTRTAKQADIHVALKPGTDGALAMGLIHVITQENLIDANYVGKYCLGYRELKQRAARFTPEVVADICGISADEVRLVAREFAAAKASAIRIGVAVERQSGGGQAIRAITCLPALVGAWKYPGGGAVQMTLWSYPLKWDKMTRGEWIKPGTRVINLLEVGAALTGEKHNDPPVKSLFVYNSNPLSMAPNQEKVRRGLEREDLFTVVSEHFLTDTANYADIVLPAAMQAEQLDIMFSWGHFYLLLNQPAVPPAGEAVSNTELFRRLSKAMGLRRPHLYRDDWELIEEYVDWDSDTMRGITLDYLKENGWARLWVGGSPDIRAPHSEGNFLTPSGKCEFVATGAAEGNHVKPALRSGYVYFQDGSPIDPIPNYIPPVESPETNADLAHSYPLNLVAGKAHAFLNTQYANEPTQRERQGAEQSILVHPDDANVRDIETGDRIRLFNDRGQFGGVAKVTADVRKGVIYACVGYWDEQTGTRSGINAVTDDRHADMGRAGAYADVLVQAEKVA